ncbi:type VI secretion system baseplate subunit TssE [Sphingomonas sp. H39-1-10]|uniref:type VI secretion system baseplate subunit TssE n=1 Tax=Sphingomonas TaxID=13687 RepID=UPI0008882454|nr:MULTISPECIES: type VI secretion system baseplate subunit TssE [Sphingomonas]MDF0487854.1 type VI secretion system baseplate subunit TssE [Sphingomonas pollutisoli]SDA24787.1 type VI secretion system protein ImpF [Sphingomonas sp. NFR15]
MTPTRANPTLFDKLVADLELDGLRSDAEEVGAIDRASLRYYTVPRIERFNEAALRATVLRELNWLLNTTNLAAVQDLSSVPEVAASTLNYGLGDLTGRLLTRPGVQARAREMRQCIAAFEPRVARASLDVQPDTDRGRPHRIGFVIRGDLTAAARALPVVFRSDFEIDTGAVELWSE